MNPYELTFDMNDDFDLQNTTALEFLHAKQWSRIHKHLRVQLIQHFNLKSMSDVLHLTRDQIFSLNWLEDAPKNKLWIIIQKENLRRRIRDWN